MNHYSIRKDFLRTPHGREINQDDIQVDFEHGGWWVTVKPTGAQYAVNEASNGFDYEQVTAGDDK